MSEKSNEAIKRRTQELYDLLPDNKEERISKIDIRDEIISLNENFFGYVAAHTFVNNRCISHEDKFQSCILHFCEIWWKYKWVGDEEERGYRQDLSFAVFFKPRLSEMIERELVEVKYSIRRSLCMEAGDQLGKHWSKVRYEDLANVNLPKDKMDSLKAIFGSMYIADLDQHSTYIQSEDTLFEGIQGCINDESDSIEQFLINEMIETESDLNNRALNKLADILQIDVNILKQALPGAKKKLYNMIQHSLSIREDF